ncbi:unnamed protein product, partial [Scytosiphon promiscuus]
MQRQDDEEPTQGSRHSLDALTVAIDQHSPEGWYVSTLQLQLASMQLCLACRRFSTLEVRVEEGTPSCVWARSTPLSEQGSRVPPLRAVGLTWELDYFLIETARTELTKNLQRLELYSPFLSSVEGMIWPSRLKHL